MIPKIIHQTYKEVDNLPPVYKSCQDKIKALHLDWEYKFWTDADMYAEVLEFFPDLYPIFMKLPRKILQIDVFRYCLMWKYGGLYADLDYRFVKTFDLLDTRVILPISRQSSSGQWSTLMLRRAI
jgi:mannosyltransferase OCH1-like enzyme